MANEKMVVFRCAGCIEDLKDHNPYVNTANESIPLENIICIEVPKEKCENTNFEMKPILVEERKSFYYDIEDDAKLSLLNKAIENAIAGGYKLKVKIWEDSYAREEGLPISRDMEEYLDDDDEVSIAEALLYATEDCYGKGGCAEIVAEDDSDDYCFYHDDSDGDQYIYCAIFDFLQSA